jgi:Secretion system C-terminal sorting domain
MKRLILLFLLSPVFCFGQWNQLGTDIDGQAANEQSGSFIKMNANGTVVIIGAPRAMDAGITKGKARVFQWNGTSWLQKGSDLVGTSQGDVFGDAVSISSDGNIIAVGAPGFNNPSSPPGYTRVYEWNGSNYIQKGTDIIGEANGNSSGTAVSLSSNGNTIAIGAGLNSNANGSFSGHCRIFEWSGTAWVQKGADIDGEAAQDFSGDAVSINANGTIVAIGAAGNDGAGPTFGHVRVYEWTGTSWVQKGTDIDGVNLVRSFGLSLSIDAIGSTFIAGGWAGSNGSIGSVRIITWNGTNWVQKGATLSGVNGSDFFGTSVDINADGSTIIAGTQGTTGYAKVFKFIASAWVQQGADLIGEANFDQFGRSSSISSNGNIVAVGTGFNDGNGVNAGHVRVLENINASTATTAACIAPANMAVTLSTNTVNGFTNPISLSAVSGVPAGTNITFSNNPVTPGGSTLVTLNGTNTLAPGTYNISIQGTATSATTQITTVSFVINPGASPTINTQPISQTICEGANVSFSIAAPTASNFQWQVSTNAGANWTNISGANNATLTLNAVVNTLNGNLYRCQASTICGNTNSNNATLTVNTVSIVTNPADVDNCVGTNASFTVVGTSPQSINYQWQVSTDGGTNFNNIAGANSAMLTITNTTTVLNNNRYRCLLTTASCTTPSISAAVKLSVRALPTIALAAAPLTTLLPTQTTILTATTSTTNGGTLATSWFYNAAPLTVTGNNYTVAINQAGNYSATIKETYAGGLQCSNTSATVAITAVESDKLFIFPTPNDGTFNVTFYNSSNANSKRFVSVYDAKGALVYKKEFAISGYYTLLPINLKNASRGYYFVVVLDAAGKKLKEGKVFVR